MPAGEGAGPAGDRATMRRVMLPAGAVRIVGAGSLLHSAIGLLDQIDRLRPLADIRVGPRLSSCGKSLQLFCCRHPFRGTKA